MKSNIMKKLFTLLMITIFSAGLLFSQEIPPQAFSYMAVIKKSNGQPLVNKTISFQASILESDIAGTAVYIETFKITTNSQGQIEVQIGRGEPVLNTFSAIDWSSDAYFLKTEVDIAGGTNYQLLAVTQLLSVPYALYAGRAGSVTNELQQLSIDGSTLSLSGGGGAVVLPPTNVIGYFCWADKDADSFGNKFDALWIPENVTMPLGYVLNAEDCNDNNIHVYPTASDICDKLDNDCDGLTDEDCDECLMAGIEFLTCIEFNCGGLQAFSDGYNENALICAYMFCAGENQCIDLICALEFVMYESDYLLSLTVEEQAAYILQHCGVSDKDDDGYTPASGDCNDLDPSVHAGAIEICDDGIDQNCNGRDLKCNDMDDDGFTADVDCNDQSAEIHPGANEPCGEEDWNCDGEITPCVDNDLDGFNEIEDCNDNNPEIYPGAREVCDELDNDCNGEIDDEPIDGVGAFVDGDRDGFGGDYFIFVCEPISDGYVLVNGDCDDSNSAIYPGAQEICDEMDNDCDGEIDNNVIDGIKVYRDDDYDGFGSSEYLVVCEFIPEGYVTETGDCDDSNGEINPVADEICDGRDNDCDGITDEDLIPPFIVMSEGVCGGATAICDGANGWKEPDYSLILHYEYTETTCDELDNDCDGIVDEGCLTPDNTDDDGDGLTENQGDCNDADNLIYPAANDAWYDGIDSNCDGMNDFDQDLDGFVALGYESFIGGTAFGSGDCDDADVMVYPGAIDTWYDGIDSNCDGMNDFDQDLDGYVALGYESFIGRIAYGGGDCNDNDPSIYPGAFEYCDDGVDQDCDGQDLSCDADGDGISNIDEDLNRNENIMDDDTDDDGIPNYLDPDDDNDGINTISEDANGDGDPTNDDTDSDGVPDYLDIN